MGRASSARSTLCARRERDDFAGSHRRTACIARLRRNHEGLGPKPAPLDRRGRRLLVALAFLQLPIPPAARPPACAALHDWLGSTRMVQPKPQRPRPSLLAILQGLSYIEGHSRYANS